MAYRFTGFVREGTAKVDIGSMRLGLLTSWWQARHIGWRPGPERGVTLNAPPTSELLLPAWAMSQTVLPSEDGVFKHPESVHFKHPAGIPCLLSTLVN